MRIIVGYRIVYARQQKKSKAKLWISLIGVALVLALAAGWFFFVRDDGGKTDRTVSTQTPQKVEEEPPEPPKPPLVDLQPTVNKWLKTQSADFGIVVYDPDNQEIIASHNPDNKYFAASLYKLFVAYLALEDFQEGRQNPSEILTGGFTRKECVDKMIRESHSPCGEAMMADIGQEALRVRVSEKGIKNTVFAGITTTARDTALILQRIVEMQELTPVNTAFLKDAMRVQEQRFRNGLAKGAPQAKWETKVGWNEQYNYHDVGIMTLPNKRVYVVTILSQGNGSPTPIADFARTIYHALQ